LGVVVSRKIGNAVVRNRVKRRIREILRQEPEIFGDGSTVVILTKPIITELRYPILRDLIVAKLKEALANYDI
jgi:ribonuclease P protein component